MYVEPPYTSRQPDAAHAHAQKPEHSPNPSTCHFLEVSSIAPMEALSLNLLKASAIPPAGRRPLYPGQQRGAHQLQHLLEHGGLCEHTPQTPSIPLNPSTRNFLEVSPIAPMETLSLNLPNASAIPPAGRRLLHLGRRRAAHQLQHLLERGDRRREHTPPKPEHSPNPSTCHFPEVSPIAPMEALSLNLPSASAFPLSSPSESERHSSGRAAASTS
jgi:hypothetical protein